MHARQVLTFGALHQVRGSVTVDAEEQLAALEDVRRHARSVIALCGLLANGRHDPVLEQFAEDAAVSMIQAERKRDALLLQLPPAIQC